MAQRHCNSTVSTLFSAEAPAEYPNKKTQIKKEIARARGTMERGKDSDRFSKNTQNPLNLRLVPPLLREPQVLPESYMAEASVVSFPFPS